MPVSVVHPSRDISKELVSSLLLCLVVLGVGILGLNLNAVLAKKAWALLLGRCLAVYVHRKVRGSRLWAEAECFPRGCYISIVTLKHSQSPIVGPKAVYHTFT